jgi:cold shock CspA family protein
MMQGIVRRIDRQGMYGFVESDYPDFEDHFFHFTELWELPFSESLIGKRMEFESHHTAKGKLASNVRPIDIERYANAARNDSQGAR